MQTQPKKAPVAGEQGTISLDPRYTDVAFTRVPNWVMERLGTLSRDARYTFIVLLKYARQDGHCFPGMDTLSADLGASRQSVHRWINELEMVGLVEVRRGGKGYNNDYIFHWPDWLDDDVTQTLPQANDVKPALHQGRDDDVKPTLHQGRGRGDDVKRVADDVKQVLHNKDTDTKTHITTTVAPAVMSTNKETSARSPVVSTTHARARVAPKPVPLHQETQDINPQPDWVLPLAQRIQQHWGGTLSAEERDAWCACLWEKLHDVKPALRERFLAYLFSNGWLKTLNSPRGVLKVLGQDADKWRNLGYPTSKAAQQHAPTPKVPAHIQREHDLAYKPKTRHIDANSSPEEIARIVAKLRKYEGEESAQKWLRSIMAEGEGA